MKYKDHQLSIVIVYAITETLMEEKRKFIKVCILTRESTPKSVLAAIKGEKQPLKISLPKAEFDVAIDSNLTAVILEADEVTINI